MNFKLLTGLSVLLSASVFGASCGRPFYRHRHFTPENVKKISDRIASKLDMNDVQKKKMDELSKKIAQRLPLIQKHRREMSDVVLKQFESDSFNRGEVEASMKSHQDEMLEMQKFAASSMEEFYSILTPEQRKKVVAFMKKRREYREKH